MKQTATACNSTPAQTDGAERQSHGARFTKVLDGRKQPVRGLWKRNGRYYAQLTFEDASTGAKKTKRASLLDKDGSVPQSDSLAVAALQRMKTQRIDNTLPVLGRTPAFAQFVDSYLAHVRAGTEEKMKRSATIEKEASALRRWAGHLGTLRLDKIRRAHINAFTATRKRKGMSNRTVNLDVIIFRNLMKHAIDEGHITVLPTQNMRPLSVATRKRPLADPEKLCDAAFGTKKNEKGEDVPVTENGQQFVDYIRFMAYSGGRRNESLRVRWADVDMEKEQVTLGADGDAKAGTWRAVDFNGKLKALLHDMFQRRAPDSQWLFPSPQRGSKDMHAKSFRESLEMVRAVAGLPKFGFHDCRHFFVSFCVMSGIDYMTIARWVDHKDGGVLIGKVYGHLADSHSRMQAKRVSFEPQIVKEAA